jgi:hypothetical protein
MCRKKRDTLRGSPGFLAAQKTLARNDSRFLETLRFETLGNDED